MVVALFALLLAAADPSSWPADPTRPVVISETDWLRRPTPAQLADAWPAAARAAGTTGKVLMNCLLAYDGGLKDCQVISETPPGMGFGAAALSLAGAYQLTPVVDGQSATDGRIVISVRFQPPG
ncbi:MAG: TonB family protein [Caulobacter sp.]|nr:TonB family protein [Caulobacter sp.]